MSIISQYISTIVNPTPSKQPEAPYAKESKAKKQKRPVSLGSSNPATGAYNSPTETALPDRRGGRRPLRNPAKTADRFLLQESVEGGIRAVRTEYRHFRDTAAYCKVQHEAIMDYVRRYRHFLYMREARKDITDMTALHIQHWLVHGSRKNVYKHDAVAVVALFLLVKDKYLGTWPYASQRLHTIPEYVSLMIELCNIVLQEERIRQRLLAIKTSKRVGK